MSANSVLAKMAVYLDANTLQFNSKLAESNKVLNSFASTASFVGKSLIGTFGVYQAFSGLKAGIQIAAEFEAQMSAVRAITDATNDEFKQLEGNALALGQATKFSATQVGSLQTEFARLGFSTNEILAATKATIDLATATGEDLTKSTIIVGSAIRQFNLPASEAGHIADVMAGAFNKTALALDDFGEAMKYVGPAAAAANLTFEQTSALLGILADSGIKGSQAGTSLRRILTDLAKDGRPLSERLGELSAKGISLQNAFDDIGRVASTALIVLEKGKDKVDPLALAFRNLNGEAERVAAIMRDNLEGDFDKLTAKLKTATIEGFKLSGALAGLRATTQGLTFLVDPIGALSKSQTDKLNNEARATFLTYAKGFGDVSEAAKKFEEVQYRLILAAQIEEAENARLFKTKPEFLKEINKRLQDEIALRFRSIDAAKEYIRATAPDAQGNDSPQVRSIKFLEDEIKRLEDLQQGAADHSVFAQYQKQIDSLKLEISNIAIQLKKLPDNALDVKTPEQITAKSFSNAKQAFNVDSTAFEGRGIDHINESTKALDKQIKSLEKIHEGFKKASTSIRTTQLVMLEFSKQTGQVEKIIVNWGQALKDLAGVAIVSFADSLGKAIAGQEDFGKAFLESFAGFLKQFGSLLIAAGVAKIAADLLLETPAGGAAAIAAGVALVALASFMSTKANPAHNAGSTATANVRSQAISSEGTAVQVSGQLVVRGQDLFVSLSNYQRNKNG